MPPIKSNQIKESCTSISSNCVVWQGPDLDCINVCTGESVSETIHSLATTLCEVKKDLDLSDVELQCIIDTCASCPSPDKKLKTVLELIIGKVCDLEELIVGGGTNEYKEPDISLSCLSYTDTNGDIISTLSLSNAVKRVIFKLCQVVDEIAIINADIDLIDSRVTALEAKGSYVPPTVTVTCIDGSTDQKDLDEAIDIISAELCDLKESLGPTITDISVASGKQCKDISTSQALSYANGVTMGGAYASEGWKSTVNSLADSFTNLWLTVCDIRSAVLAIQNNCCKISCDDIVIDFDAKIIDNELYLYFATKSNLPNGFYDFNATLGNKFLFTDANGATWSSYVKLREDVFDDPDVYVNGYLVENAINSPIDWKTKVNVTSDISMTDGSSTCVKCMNVNIGPLTSDSCCTITATKDNTIIVYETYI
jgi:hypothetical protein